MKEVYLHKNDIPKSCVDCDFRQDTYCKAQRIDDGEYVSCNQSKSRMKNGKPITCPLKCIESGGLCEQKTCKNMTEKNPVDEFICSECGFHYEDVSETREDEDGEYSYKVEFVTKYCPNCGAKVEDEE